MPVRIGHRSSIDLRNCFMANSYIKFRYLKHFVIEQKLIIIGRMNNNNNTLACFFTILHLEFGREVSTLMRKVKSRLSVSI